MFYCKEKNKVIVSGKAYAVCLARGCPNLLTVSSKKSLSKLKKKYQKKEKRKIIV